MDFSLILPLITGGCRRKPVDAGKGWENSDAMVIGSELPYHLLVSTKVIETLKFTSQGFEAE